jgi:hypothetical protein
MKNLIDEHSKKTLLELGQIKEKPTTKEDKANLKNNNFIANHNKQTILSCGEPGKEPPTASEFKIDKWNRKIE